MNDEQRELKALRRELEQRHFDQVEKRARRLILRGRGSVFVLNALAVVLAQMGRKPEALEVLERACFIAPQDAQLWNNMGNALLILGRSEQAADAFAKALQLQPNYPVAHRKHAPQSPWRGGASLSGSAATQLAGSADLDRVLFQPAAHAGRLAETEPTFRRIVASAAAGPDVLDGLSQLLLAGCYLNADPLLALADARRYGELASRLATEPYQTWAPVPRGPLRVGLVSRDLSDHPVGYFLDGMLAKLEGPRVELLAYANDVEEDPMKDRLRRHFACWRSVAGLSDRDAAALIHGDRLHILIDLSGHTAYERLAQFAWRPAPLQLSWLGYFSTTGIREIDFVIADPHVVPEGTEQEFTENVWRLPRTRMCFTPPDTALELAGPPALPRGRVTFCCFNNLAKVNSRVEALWARILRANPTSVLLFKSAHLDDLSLRAQLHKRFAARGVDPDRIECEGWSSRGDYLAAYARADLALDPFPFTGGTTTVEALWLGVPVVTLRGARMVARQGESLLALCEMQDWIAATPDEYGEIATRQAADLEGLARLRAQLRGIVLASPLGDATALAGEFTAALQAMWEAVGQQRIDR